MALKLKRGTAESLSTIIPAEGELVYTTDTKRLYIGDGVTIGGISVDLGAFGGASGFNSEASANFAPLAEGDGYTGSRGEAGYTGSRGATGLTGSRGFAGSRGVSGFTGSRGSNGVPGFGGSRGFNGSQGFTGSRGYTGSAGAGATGSRGFSGSRGYTGSAGAGFTGSSGVGVTGSRGYTGSAGSGGGVAVYVMDILVKSSVDTINFIGDGVSASAFNDTSVSVSIPGLTVGYTGSAVNRQVRNINFVGAGVAVTNVNNTDITVTIPGGGGSGVGYTGSAGSVGYTGSAGGGGGGGYTGSVGYTGSAGSVGYTGSAGGGGGGPVSSLNNGSKALSLSSTGILAFPDNALTAPTATDFSIKTDTGFTVSAVVTIPGTGFGAVPNITNTSATTGGSGTGLTVRYATNGSGGVRGVEIVNPGTGYVSGNELTLVAGGGNAKITLSIGLTTNTWTFGKNGTTTFPNKLDFGTTRIDIGDGYEGNTLILASGKQSITDNSNYAIIMPETGTQANPYATDLRILGGLPYRGPAADSMPANDGGNVWIEATGGATRGGAVLINSGNGVTGGQISIRAGTGSELLAIDGGGGGGAPPPAQGYGGIINIEGGYGSQDGGGVSIAAGNAGGVDGFGAGGDVVISGGSSGQNDDTGIAGNVIILGGEARNATGTPGKVTITNDSSLQGGDTYSWHFMPNGAMSFPINSAPTNSYGKDGDQQGMVAFADGYLYYCNEDYVDDDTDIWMRVALDATSW